MSKKSGGGWGINKFSFWLLTITALLIMISWILGKCGVHEGITGWLTTVATGIMVCIVGVLSWRYVRKQSSIAWTILWLLVIIIIAVFMILPRFGI